MRRVWGETEASGETGDKGEGGDKGDNVGAQAFER